MYSVKFSQESLRNNVTPLVNYKIYNIIYLRNRIYKLTNKLANNKQSAIVR